MNNTIIDNGIKECCQEQDNLELKETVNDEEMFVCKVCGCRHFVLTVDPLKMNLTAFAV